MMPADMETCVSAYMDDISRYPVMTRDAEIASFEALHRGDPGARDRIVRGNLRFVVKIALGYQGRGLPLSDLIQEGNMGLLEVIDRFDHTRGFRFSTYAAFWIRQAIQLALRRKTSLVKLPMRKARQADSLRQQIQQSRLLDGCDPDFGRISENTGISIDDMMMLMEMPEIVAPLEEHGDSDGVDLLETLQDERAVDAREVILERELREHVRRVLSILSPRERRILALRHGIEDGVSRSLREVSREIGLSQEGVRRIERRAIDRIRRHDMCEPLTQCA